MDAVSCQIWKSTTRPWVQLFVHFILKHGGESLKFIMSMKALPLTIGLCRERESLASRRPRRTTTQSMSKTSLRKATYVAKCNKKLFLCHLHSSTVLPALLDIEVSIKLHFFAESFDLTTILDPVYNCSVASPTPFCLDVSDRQLTDPHLSQTEYFGRVSKDPVPALSLSIETIEAESQSHSRTAVETSLFHAVIKRSLVGIRILWEETKLTSELQVEIGVEVILLRVQSVHANTSYGRAPTHFVVLPSTRITLSSKSTAYKDDYQATRKRMRYASPATKLLVETMDCIRSHPDVPLARTFLFSGQPGTGKTHAVRLAVEAMGSACQMVALNGSEIMSLGHGGPEAALSLEKVFLKAHRDCMVDTNALAFVFLDEFDAMVDSDCVNAMLGMLLDRISTDKSWWRIIVVAATNNVDAVPATLRRPGRFDKDFVFIPPDLKDRQSMLRQIIQHTGGLGPDMDNLEIESLAEQCVGFVPADLVALVRKAIVLKHANPEGTTPFLLNQALSFVGASALRDAALTAPPETNWSHIAGDCGGAKLALQQAVEWPRTRRGAYQHLGLQIPRGCLLYGPPGTGKTLLARAAAGSSGVAFLSLSPADVYASSYVGDAEAIIRRAFSTARAAAPCILFFDEIDSILGFDDNVSQGMSRGHSAEARTLSTFLNEMDGVDGSLDDGVMVLGATNRPETIDRALLRPGRFDKVIHVPPPDFIGRRALLELQCRGWSTEEPLDYDYLAGENVTGGMTGAELVGACREAAMKVFHESLLQEQTLVMGQNILLDVLSRVHKA